MPVTRQRKKVPSVPVVPAKRKGEPKVEQHRVTLLMVCINRNLEEFKQAFNLLLRKYCPTQRAKSCICIMLLKRAIFLRNVECVKWLLDTYFTKICHQDCLACVSGEKSSENVQTISYINMSELIKHAHKMCGELTKGSYRMVSVLFCSMYYYSNHITSDDKFKATLAFMNYVKGLFIKMYLYTKPKYRMERENG